MAEITEKTENCELVANCDRLVAVDNIEPLIKVIRGQQVMLDRDLATLYGVETKRLNEQVKRNIKRFPEDFMFQLTKDECLRSQIVTLNAGRGQFYGENRLCIQPLRNNGILVREKAGFSRHMPLGFPRHPPPEFSRCQLPHKATKIRNDIHP